MENISRLFQKRKAGFIFFVAFFIFFNLDKVPEAISADLGSMLSRRGHEFAFGGKLELEYVDSQADGRVLADKSGVIEQKPNPLSRVSIDKIVISPRIRLKTGILFRADIEFKTGGGINLDEAWVKIPGLPFNSWVKFGLEDLFIKPTRKTESYPIIGHAFWQDEDLGLFLGGEGKLFYWRVSVTNGRHLKDRRISEDDVFPITTDDDDNKENNNNKQVGFGLGIDHTFNKGHKIDFLPFYYRSKLSEDEVTNYLQKITTYPTGDLQDSQERVGFNLDYRFRDFAFFGQYIEAKDGAMDRDGWYVQPSYKYRLGHKRLSSLVFLIRYEEYNVDLARDPFDSRTWDRQTTTVAVIASVVKGFKLKTEYSFNDEETGGPDVDNNELLVQLEIKF